MRYVRVFFVKFKVAFLALVGLLGLFQNCSTREFSLNQNNWDQSSTEKTFSSIGNGAGRYEWLIHDSGKPFNELSRRSAFSESNKSSNSNLSIECNIDGLAPLLTHFPDFLGTEVTPIGNPSLAEEIQNGNQHPSVYSSDIKNYLPSVNNYIGDNFDVDAVSADEVQETLQILCDSKIKQVRLIQPTREIFKYQDLKSLIEVNKPYFQVIHSIVFKKNLFTIVIPPYFNEKSQYATLVNGFYGLNINFSKLEGRDLMAIAKQVYDASNKGFIGILWNGGGAIGSRTMNPQSMKDFNEFATIYLSATKANPKKFVSFGVSRGAWTALNLASNPEVTAAQFKFVDAAVPPGDIDKIASLASVTVPILLGASDWSSGILASWHQDFSIETPKKGFLTGPQYHLYVLTGATDRSSFENDLNLLTPKKIQKLKDAGTNIFLQLGSHDFIVPWVDQFRLYHRVLQQKLNAEIQLNYLYGHDLNYKERVERLVRVMKSLASGDSSNGIIKIGNVRTFLSPRDQTLEEFSVSEKNPITNPVLTIEFPKYIADKVETPFIATGPANSKFAFVLGDDQNNYKVIGVPLNADGTAVIQPEKSNYQSNKYTLVKVFKMDRNGNPINEIKYRSTIGVDSPVEIITVKGNILDWSIGISGKIREGIFNKDDGTSYPGVKNNTNLGIVEIGTGSLTPSDIRYGREAFQSRVGPSLRCESTGPLSKFSMNGTINVSNYDLDLPGHYFVYGYDPNANKWWSFANKKWQQIDLDDKSDILSTPTEALKNPGIAFFVNENLSSYQLGEIYLGYGVGKTKAEAWEDMQNHTDQSSKCGILPNAEKARRILGPAPAVNLAYQSSQTPSKSGTEVNICVEEPYGTFSCAQFAGQYGIPPGATVGNASLKKNSCSGVITYIGGCSIPETISTPIVPLPVASNTTNISPNNSTVPVNTTSSTTSTSQSIDPCPVPDRQTYLNASLVAGTVGKKCYCSPAAASDSTAYVWGTRYSYTSGSSICRAAVNSGVITTAGGMVTVNTTSLGTGCAAYPGSLATGETVSGLKHGVTTFSWSSANGVVPYNFYFSGTNGVTAPVCSLALTYFQAPDEYTCNYNVAYALNKFIVNLTANERCIDGGQVCPGHTKTSRFGRCLDTTLISNW